MSVTTELHPHEKGTCRTFTALDQPRDKKNVFSINFNPYAIFKGFLFFTIFLLIANLAAVFFQLNPNRVDPYRLARLFTFDSETNIPTFYSAVTLLFCAGLLTIIAAAQKRLGASGLPWFGLAATFLFLSIDEAASLHEKLTVPFRDFFNPSGLLFFAWVIPYGVALALFCLIYFRFLLELPRKIMFLTLASGVTYISGAMGFEMISGLWAEAHGSKDLIYSLIVTCEELLEMLGIVFYIYTLLLYISGRFEKITITAVENLAVNQIVFEGTPLTSYPAGLPAQPYMRSRAIETPPSGGGQGAKEVSGTRLA